MPNAVEDVGAQAVRAVTKSDTVALPNGACRALWIGGAGNVTIKAVGDSAAVELVGVAAGTVLPVRATHVMAATTATDIVALY